MSEQFHSQFGEDRWIASNIDLPEKGFYLDIGCGHPFLQSNTAFLRERGWDGIAIDGNPQWLENWKNLSNHFRQGVVTQGRQIVMFDIHAVPEYSRVNPNGGFKYLSVTLDDLIGDKCVDFLSLDVEGSEYDVILGTYPNKLPRVIVSEYNTAGIGEDFRVRDHLFGFGYSQVYQTTSNIVFVRK